MPEGDTVYLAAARLDAALSGKELTRCDIRVPRYATVDLAGRVVDETVSRGKHLLTRVGDVTIHTHLKMEGVWHTYGPSDRWRRPGFQARIILATSDITAVGFTLGIVEVLRRDAEDRAVGHLGPDLLGADWNPAEAVRRLLREPQLPIGTALLDQRNLAGIGNIYRSETCFVERVDPRTPVGAVADLRALVDTAHTLLLEAVRRPPRRTLVYGRIRQPCPRCGNGITYATLGDGTREERSIYYCVTCLR